MSGSATATAAHNFVSPNPALLHPSLSNDPSAASHPAARTQLNAWGWPSGFNQPPHASNTNLGAPSPSRHPPPSSPLATATMFTPQAQQINHAHPHQQSQLQQQQQHPPQHPQHLQHPHLQQQQQQQPHPPHLQHHLASQQQQQQQHQAQLQLQQQQQQQQQQQLQLNQASQSQQSQQQQHALHSPANQQKANTTVYPPQPYANSSTFSAPNHVASPNGSAKPNTPTAQSVIMTKKRTASKSPDFESKDKRSRPDDPAGTSDSKPNDANAAHPSSVPDGRVWGEEATKLDVYVWDYLSRRGFSSAAKALMNEAGMAEPPEVPLKTPQGLLFEYWAIFWDVFAARSGRGGTEAAAYFEYQDSRNMQRLADANRKAEALEAQYQPPENDSRFPNIVMSAQASDPNSSAAGAAAPNGRAPAPGAWNPAALPQAQQQQLLITAAQRQNIPLHEIKNLTPASRMALINSMNPHNPANAQAVRPGMNNPLMEQQLQARLQQQQALHRMMQQQRQVGAQPPMPPHAGLAGAAPMPGAMQVRPPVGHPQMPGAAGSPAPPTPGGPIDGRRSVGPGAEGIRPDHMAGPSVGLAGAHPQSQQQQPGQAQGGPQQPQTQQPGGPPQPGQVPGQQQQQHPQLNPHQQQMVMNQFQSVQAAMREEWMKAQNAPNQTTAADFYANVQAYQAKAQGLQNLLRAQANYQGGPAAGTPANGTPPGMLGQPGPSSQPRPPGMPGVGGPGGPAAAGSPASMANMTPQQRAAQIASAQAAAGRITPLMATHDPGLMASMMGPNSMPNGTPNRPNVPLQQGAPGQQQGQQQASQPQQPPARPPSAQPEDPHTSHFSSVQMGSPAGIQRPGMQRAGSQLGPNPPNAGGMGPPGAASISSPSPRISATNLQQQQQQQQSQAGGNASNAPSAGSPAPSNVPNTPKLGSAEKGKKGNARQRKNSKAATKTPVLTAAAVPSSSGSATNTSAPGSSNGAAAPSTPATANAATPVSTSVTTPGREAMAGKDASASGAPQPTSQPIDAAMPPPSGPGANPTDASHFGSASGGNAGADQADGSANVNGISVGDNGGADGSGGAGGASGGADDFSMFGFGGSMNDIFDFDLSTDGTGAQSLGSDGWDSNFGNLFGSSSGAPDGS